MCLCLVFGCYYTRNSIQERNPQKKKNMRGEKNPTRVQTEGKSKFIYDHTHYHTHTRIPKHLKKKRKRTSF